jgi:hypothetical protein
MTDYRGLLVLESFSRIFSERDGVLDVYDDFSGKDRGRVKMQLEMFARSLIIK